VPATPLATFFVIGAGSARITPIAQEMDVQPPVVRVQRAGLSECSGPGCQSAAGRVVRMQQAGLPRPADPDRRSPQAPKLGRNVLIPFRIT
jgi:hypothetical protein